VPAINFRAQHNREAKILEKQKFYSRALVSFKEVNEAKKKLMHE
jgi:hypothetical protein